MRQKSMRVCAGKTWDEVGSLDSEVLPQLSQARASHTRRLSWTQLAPVLDAARARHTQKTLYATRDFLRALDEF